MKVIVIAQGVDAVSMSVNQYFSILNGCKKLGFNANDYFVIFSGAVVGTSCLLSESFVAKRLFRNTVSKPAMLIQQDQQISPGFGKQLNISHASLFRKEAKYKKHDQGSYQVQQSANSLL